MPGTGIGAPVRRKEDFRFLTGKGNYVDDINRPNQTYAYILRSPHAHAALGKIDTAKAKAAPGVIAIFTGEDIKVGSSAVRLGGQIQGRLAAARAAASGAGPRQGAPCRRPGRGGHRRHQGAGQGRGRADRGRLQAAAGGHRHGGRGQARRAAGARCRAEQCLLRSDNRRTGPGRCDHRQGGARHQDRDRQQPTRRQCDGAARRDRRI